MATAPDLTLVIKAVDNASAAIGAVESKIGATAEAARSANRAIAGINTHAFAGISGQVNLLRGHFGHLRASIGGVAGRLTSLMPMLAGLGAAGSLAGMFALTHSVAESRAAAEAAAEKIGITTGQLGALKAAAKMTHVDVDVMTGGLAKLNKAIATSALGKNKDAAAMFARMGIALKDSSGQMVTVADIIPQIADALSKTQSAAMRSYVATTLFGKSGNDLLPMLIKGGAEMRGFADAMGKVTYRWRPEDKSNMENFERSWITLDAAVKGVQNSIAAKLAPVLTPVIQKFTDFIAKNREWILTGIVDKISDLGKWILRLDFDKIARDTATWTGNISDLVDRFGGLKLIAIGFAATVAAPILGGIASMVAAFRLLNTTSTEAMLASQRATAAGGAGGGVAGGIGGAVSGRSLLAGLNLATLIGVDAWDALVNGKRTPLPDNIQSKMLENFPALRRAIENKPEVPKVINPLAPGYQSPLQHTRALQSMFGLDPSLFNVGVAGERRPSFNPFDPSLFNVGVAGERRSLPVGPYTAAQRDRETAAGAPVQGQVDVRVRIENAPPGTTADVTSQGAVRAPPPEVGYSFMNLY